MVAPQIPRELANATDEDPCHRCPEVVSVGPGSFAPENAPAPLGLSSEVPPVNYSAPTPNYGPPAIYPMHRQPGAIPTFNFDAHNGVVQGHTPFPPTSMHHQHGMPSTQYSAPPPPRTNLPLLPPVPISDDESDELPSVDQVLSKIAKPAVNVAGSRRADPKGKGKAKAVDNQQPVASGTGKRKNPPTLSAQPETKRSRGRVTGAANYSPTDIDLLLDAAEEVLPLGGVGWAEVEQLFNQRAKLLGRPTRTSKSLELKLKQLAKTSKPTGDAECPPHVIRAYKIDSAMSEKAGTRELDDEEIVDIEEDEVVDEDRTQAGNPPGAAETASRSTFVARHNPDRQRSAPTNSTTGRHIGQTLLTSIGSALDPSARQARHDELSIQYMQSNQILQLNSQVRESHRRLDALSAQLAESERRYLDAERRSREAERRADRVEMQMMISSQQNSHHNHTPTPSSSRVRTPAPPPPRRQALRQEIYYSDGGRATRWIEGRESDDEADLCGLNDSPGTRRYTFFDGPDDLPPSTQSLPSSSLEPTAPLSQEFLPPRLGRPGHNSTPRAISDTEASVGKPLTK